MTLKEPMTCIECNGLGCYNDEKTFESICKKCFGRGMLNSQLFICKKCNEEFSNTEDCGEHASENRHYSFYNPKTKLTLGFV